MNTDALPRIALTIALALAPFAARAQTQPQRPPPPRACSMVGLWAASYFVTDFSQDGRWQTYDSVALARRQSPRISGTYSAEHGGIRFVANDNVYHYRVSITGNACESLSLVLVSDDRQQHAPGYRIDFRRVLESEQQ
jgi:hypothetical protein